MLHLSAVKPHRRRMMLPPCKQLHSGVDVGDAELSASFTGRHRLEAHVEQRTGRLKIGFSD